MIDPVKEMTNAFLGLANSKKLPNASGNKRMKSKYMPLASIKDYKIQVFRPKNKMTVTEITIIKM